MGIMDESIELSDFSPLGVRINAVEGALTRSEGVLAQWLQRNEDSLAIETGATIAAKTGLSEITVSRFLRRIGYKGIVALKEDLRASASARLGGRNLYLRLMDSEMGTLIRRDAEAVLAIGNQIARPEWQKAIDAVDAADEVYVTGFQTVKGAAEDFGRRLSIIHSGVRFVVAHETGLAEWISRTSTCSCLILIDTVPYAREAEATVRLACRRGMFVIVITEELNTWAAAHTPYVFFVVNKVHAYVESSGPLVSLLSLMIHAVASKNPEKTKVRLNTWSVLLRELDLF